MTRDNLKFHILPGEYNPLYSDLYSDAFFCWKEVWDEVWLKEGVNKVTTSDNFTRQDFIFVITDGEEVGGVALVKKYDSQDPILFNDSAFTYDVPTKVQRRIRGIGDEFYIFSALATKKKFRKTNVGVMLAACCAQLVVEDEIVEVGFATTRNTQGVNKIVGSFNTELLDTVNVNYGQKDTEPSSIFFIHKGATIPDYLYLDFQKIRENKNDFRTVGAVATLN